KKIAPWVGPDHSIFESPMLRHLDPLVVEWLMYPLRRIARSYRDAKASLIGWDYRRRWKWETNMRYLVVGAGFAGAVVAERLASSGKKVLVIDSRNHIGGNAYDELDEHGVLVHRYGPHLFHTNSKRVFDYLSRFTSWHNYEHRVLSSVNGKLYPFPINRTTLNQLYNLQLDEAGAADFFEKVREPRDPVRTSEDLVLNT